MGSVNWKKTRLGSRGGSRDRMTPREARVLPQSLSACHPAWHSSMSTYLLVQSSKRHYRDINYKWIVLSLSISRYAQLSECLRVILKHIKAYCDHKVGFWWQLYNHISQCTGFLYLDPKLLLSHSEVHRSKRNVSTDDMTTRFVVNFILRDTCWM